MSINYDYIIRSETSSKGFTLIELILAIAVISLLSTLAVPSFKNTLNRYKLEVAARELAQNVRLIQQKSVTEGVSNKIVLDLNKRDNYQLVSGRRGKLIKLPPDVYIDWTTYVEVDKSIVFYPTGAPNRGGTIAITNGRDSLFVIISVATGRVRIDKSPP